MGIRQGSGLHHMHVMSKAKIVVLEVPYLALAKVRLCHYLSGGKLRARPLASVEPSPTGKGRDGTGVPTDSSRVLNPPNRLNEISFRIRRSGPGKVAGKSGHRLRPDLVKVMTIFQTVGSQRRSWAAGLLLIIPLRPAGGLCMAIGSIRESTGS